MADHFGTRDVEIIDYTPERISSEQLYEAHSDHSRHSVIFKIHELHSLVGDEELLLRLNSMERVVHRFKDAFMLKRLDKAEQQEYLSKFKKVLRHINVLRGYLHGRMYHEIENSSYEVLDPRFLENIYLSLFFGIDMNWVVENTVISKTGRLNIFLRKATYHTEGSYRHVYAPLEVDVKRMKELFKKYGFLHYMNHKWVGSHFKHLQHWIKINGVDQNAIYKSSDNFDEFLRHLIIGNAKSFYSNPDNFRANHILCLKEDED